MSTRAKHIPHAATAFCVRALSPLLMPAAGQSLQEGISAYRAGDYATALENLRPLAEQGDANAQFPLGAMYQYGLGVPQDDAEAIKWSRLAAEQGDAEMQYRLGANYDFGQSVVRDYAEAVKWYLLAAEQGNWAAQRRLGTMHYYGIGVPQDYAEAVKWYRLAAQQLSDAKIQDRLGYLYEQGLGVTQDYAEAARRYRLVTWYKDAQYRLGSMYGDGRGVPQDNVTAHMWANIAAANGASPELRELMAEQLSPEQIAEAQRRARVCMQSWNFEDCD